MMWIFTLLVYLYVGFCRQELFAEWELWDDVIHSHSMVCPPLARNELDNASDTDERCPAYGGHMSDTQPPRKAAIDRLQQYGNISKRPPCCKILNIYEPGSNALVDVLI